MQALIGSSVAASSRVVIAHFAKRFKLMTGPTLTAELFTVLGLPHIRQTHGLTDAQITRFVQTLHANAEIVVGELSISPAVARDVTDAKFLALAIKAGAEFLVTNDGRDLLRIGSYQGVRIVKPAKFLSLLDSRTGAS